MKLLLLFFALPGFSTEPTAPPVIPDALRADFWHAANQFNIADAAFKAVQARIAAACGDKHYPFANSGSTVKCVPSPEPKK